MIRLLWIAVIFLCLIGLFAVARRTVVVTSALNGGYHPSAMNPTASMDEGFLQHPFLTLVHIIPGALFMILGPLQFNTKLRKRKLAWHRWSGRVFVVASLVIGVSALALSWSTSIGGFNETAATTLFGVFFLIAIVKAFLHIRRRRIALHREWMIRAFSIGLAVATIRPIVGVFFGLYMSRHFLSPHEFFGIAFWIGFTLHLIAAEVWINHTRPTQGLRVQSGSPITTFSQLKAGMER